MTGGSCTGTLACPPYPPFVDRGRVPTYGGPVPDTSEVPTENVLILSCPDQRGIVATVTALLFEHGANIEESQQFQDPRTAQFFMRIRFSVDIGGPLAQGWRELFGPVATAYGMDWSIRDAATPYRAVLMVSRFGHCLNDLLFRWRSGALNMDIPAVVSNHRDLEPLVAGVRHPVPPRAGHRRHQAAGRGGAAPHRGRARRRPGGARALHAGAQ